MKQSLMAERARIAREIHDGIAQDLVGIGYQIDTLLTHPGVSAEARELIREMRKNLTCTLGDLRLRMHRLSTEPASLHKLIQEMLMTLPRSMITNYKALEDGLPTGIAWEVHAILTEAISNIRTHSNASEILVRYHASADSLMLEIIDDGVGFDPSAASDRRGVIGMKERAHLIEAHLEITSPPSGPGSHGTRILLQFPSARV